MAAEFRFKSINSENMAFCNALVTVRNQWLRLVKVCTKTSFESLSIYLATYTFGATVFLQRKFKMLSKTRLSRCAVALALSFTFHPVFAASDNTGWFVGGTLGGTQTDFTSSRAKSDDAFVHGVYGGYNVNQWFGIDSQFLLGSYDTSDLGVLSFTPRVNYFISPQFSLFARAGVASVAVVEDIDDDEAFGGVVPTIGLGARIDIVDKVKMNVAVDFLTGELEYDDESFRRGRDVDIDQTTTSISVYYQF